MFKKLIIISLAMITVGSVGGIYSLVAMSIQGPEVFGEWYNTKTIVSQTPLTDNDAKNLEISLKDLPPYVFDLVNINIIETESAGYIETIATGMFLIEEPIKIAQQYMQGKTYINIQGSGDLNIPINDYFGGRFELTVNIYLPHQDMQYLKVDTGMLRRQSEINYVGKNNIDTLIIDAPYVNGGSIKLAGKYENIDVELSGYYNTNFTINTPAYINLTIDGIYNNDITAQGVNANITNFSKLVVNTTEVSKLETRAYDDGRRSINLYGTYEEIVINEDSGSEVDIFLSSTIDPDRIYIGIDNVQNYNIDYKVPEQTEGFALLVDIEHPFRIINQLGDISELGIRNDDDITKRDIAQNMAEYIYRNGKTNIQITSGNGTLHVYK
ncbi:MAG: hypothetical protein BEN19_00240 [Epulopiscium sp. Nuni2H_MBin003]|nr:MAG: hypothetical protein BEN19_00240 [Epulopiscium sp. Nuni2H_MBin003]